VPEMYCNPSGVLALADAVEATALRTVEFQQAWERMAAVMTADWTDKAGILGFTRVSDLWKNATVALAEMEKIADQTVKTAVGANVATVNRATGFFDGGGGAGA
jgi:hypothetical protein